MTDYILQHLWQAWLLVAVACLVLELTAGDFFILCFSIGALFAALAAVAGAGVYWQIAAFAVFTLLALFLVRPTALRYFHRNDQERVSNADALMGRKGRVVEPIVKGGFGRVQIDGDVWKAVTADGHEVAEGVQVTVVDRKSTIITVDEENKQ